MALGSGRKGQVTDSITGREKPQRGRKRRVAAEMAS